MPLYLYTIRIIQSMYYRITVLFIFLVVHYGVNAQDLQWKAGVNYFFDNTEYELSSFTQDQTMKGVHFSPEIGMSWDQSHAIFGGIDALKISGTKVFLDKIDFTAYYQYHSDNVTFKVGSFPRENLLSNYSDFFFQDSILYFRPVIQGVFWQVGSPKAYANLWLDWVSHQTAVNREAFYVGASAHKLYGSIIADFQSYIFHYANVNPTNPALSVCDNALSHISLGYTYANKQGLDTLLFAVGALAGFERDRGKGDAGYAPVGAVIRANVQYRGVGLKNTLYLGNPRMSMYTQFGGDFYWSNPFLRSSSYLQSKLYYNLFNNRWVEGKIGVNLHFTEQKVFFQQTFSAVVSLNSLSKECAIKPTISQY